MNSKISFALILAGLLNQSSFILSSVKPEVAVRLSQWQSDAVVKTDKPKSFDNLLEHFGCLSEWQQSKASISKVVIPESDGSLDGFNQQQQVAPTAPKTETTTNATTVQFHPQCHGTFEPVQRLIININNSDTFLIEPATSTKKPCHLLTEPQVKTLIDIFATIPQCSTVFVTFSSSNNQDQTTTTKTFSLTKSVLDAINQRLLAFIKSDKKIITDFSEQFNLLTDNGKNLELTPTPPMTETTEQKIKRLEMKAAAEEAKKIFAKEDPCTQSSTVVPAESQTNTPAFSFYRSPLFVAGVCSIAALAIAAFYYPRADEFIELFKDFFKNSVSQKMDSSLE